MSYPFIDQTLYLKVYESNGIWFKCWKQINTNQQSGGGVSPSYDPLP